MNTPRQVALYHGLTGQLQAVLGSHDGIVYDISWAADDSAVVTASADLTAKVWHLPQRCGSGGGSPGSAGGGSPLARQQQLLTLFGTGGGSPHAGGGGGGLWPSGRSAGGGGGTSGGSGHSTLTVEAAGSSGGGGAEAAGEADAGGEIAEEEAAWPLAVTLQHACFVYTAAFCPLPGLGGAVVVTGGYDGMLRLWDARPGAGGLLLSALQVRTSCVCVGGGVSL